MAISDSQNAAWIPGAGTLIDERFEVLSNLDKGGMGVVLRARDRVNDREVAIKMVSPNLAKQKSYRERFEREVELATSIQHPNVIRCEEFGVTDVGALFLVMELLDGLSLKQYVRNQARLSTGKTVEISLQVLEGLAAAHDRDVIHRDLKPGNIYVVEEEGARLRVKLLDFGLARSLSSEEVRLTRTGAICGTAAYVAPETLVVDSPGKTGDVYAMGLVMLEMLFGRRVYASRQMAQTFMEQLVVPARIPRRVWNEPLGRVIARALQKHPSERFADASEMSEALRAVVDQSSDFILSNEEIPPESSELPRELLDDLADGRYRTVDTLYKLPRPVPWDPDEEQDVDDRETLNVVLEEISRGDMDAAFDTIRTVADTTRASDDDRADTVRLAALTESSGAWQTPESQRATIPGPLGSEPAATPEEMRDTIPTSQSSGPADASPTTAAPHHGLPAAPVAAPARPARGSLPKGALMAVAALAAVAGCIALAGWYLDEREAAEIATSPEGEVDAPVEAAARVEPAAAVASEESAASTDVGVEATPSKADDTIETASKPATNESADTETITGHHEETVEAEGAATRAETKPARKFTRKAKAERESTPRAVHEGDEPPEPRPKMEPEVADEIVDKYMPEL